MGSLYQRFNTVSQGLNGMPSLSRTQGEDDDFDLAQHDMNGTGSPMASPRSVLANPGMDAFFDSVNDAAGGKATKFAYASEPDLPPSMQALFAPESPLSNNGDWYKQNAHLPISQNPILMGSRQLGSTLVPKILKKQKLAAATEDD